MKAFDLRDQKFGRLTAVSLVRVRGRIYWECQCQCGGRTKVVTAKLTSGWTLSCGCLHKEKSAAAKLTHGKSKTPAYYRWLQMKRRCDLKTHAVYKDYGGRGITVCDRWLDFQNFYSDMGEPPFDGASIDRIDVNGGYSPDNCRWATKEEQALNKRNSKYITFNGVTKHLNEWARILGICKSTLCTRMYQRGWSIDRAFTTPVRTLK